MRDWAGLVAAVSDPKTPLGKIVAPTITGNDKKCFEALRKDPDDETAQTELVDMLNGIIVSGKGRQVKFAREFDRREQSISANWKTSEGHRPRADAVEQKRQNRLFMEASRRDVRAQSPAGRSCRAVLRRRRHLLSAAVFASSSGLDWLRALIGSLPPVRRRRGTAGGLALDVQPGRPRSRGRRLLAAGRKSPPANSGPSSMNSGP